MNENDYLSKTRFPVTNRQTLSLRDQMLLDAVNRDDLERLERQGAALTAQQRLALAELRQKSLMAARHA